jgi:hypothetical protein
MWDVLREQEEGEDEDRLESGRGNISRDNETGGNVSGGDINGLVNTVAAVDVGQAADPAVGTGPAAAGNGAAAVVTSTAADLGPPSAFISELRALDEWNPDGEDEASASRVSMESDENLPGLLTLTGENEDDLSDGHVSVEEFVAASDDEERNKVEETPGERKVHRWSLALLYKVAGFRVWYKTLFRSGNNSFSPFHGLPGITHSGALFTILPPFCVRFIFCFIFHFPNI